MDAGRRPAASSDSHRSNIGYRDRSGNAALWRFAQAHRHIQRADRQILLHPVADSPVNDATAILEIVLDECAEQLRRHNEANGPEDQEPRPPRRIIGFLCKLTEPFQFDMLRQRAGTPLERELLRYAVSRSGRSSRNRDTESNECERYLALPSVMELMQELRAAGIVTKRHGPDRGAQPFLRGPLHHLLSNPIYIGKVPHRDQLHEGQHEPIIDQALWDAVQAKRAAAIGTKRELGNSQHGSLLTGMIRDHADRPMSPSHAVKKHRRYRYYVSSMAAAVADGAAKTPALRLPAVELEQAVVDETAIMLSDQRTIMALPQVEALALQRRIDAAQALASKLQQAGKAEVRKMLQSLGIAILVRPDRIEASISQRLFVALLDGAPPVGEDDGVRLPITIPTKADRRGYNLKLVLRSEKERPPKIDPDLIALLRKAEAARQQLFTITDSAERHDREVERIARLAFLAPDIVTAILDGCQPPSLTPRRLLKYASIPLDWNGQCRALGF